MPDDKYKAAKTKRDNQVAAVVNSSSNKKVVVAGPGTGKTHLFKEVLVGKPSSLTLTFINALVDDLSVDLAGMSQVRTLHSYARDLLKTLRNKRDINIFPRLAEVIEDDLLSLKEVAVDYQRIFHTREDKNENLAFYKARKIYYDNSYGHSDVIFAAVRELEARPDKIPTYQIVLVDEFQDFNLLEVSLINLLAQRSPVLVAGDDDQALYDFKHADPKHIREIHAGPEFQSFTLPMCSRCPRVVIEATHDIVQSALKNGRLASRIPKAYEYFDDEKKDIVSARYPRLNHKTLFASQMAGYISNQMGSLIGDFRERYSVLIVAPIKKQAKSIAASLRKKGFQSVDFADRDDGKLKFRDGLMLLLDNPKSNLGWRIVAGLRLPKNELKELLAKSTEATSPPMSDLVPSALRKETNKVLTALRRLRDGKNIDDDHLASLRSFDIDPLSMGVTELSKELNVDASAAVKPGLRKVPIKVTTVQSSKGLSADVVFITYLDDQYWVSKDGVSDRDVCNFLVALTRAKAKVFLLSSREAVPTFVSWIRPERIEKG